MKEYIEREAVERMLENAQIITYGEYCGYCTEDVNLGRIPAADVVEVVRCRECAHYKICDEWENGKRMLCEIHHHSYLDHDGDNHFCSWGQRKEADHEVS